jgi:phosphate transport system substrate-binding protein
MTLTKGGHMRVHNFLLAIAVGFVTVAQAQTVRVDGSSTVFPITEGIAEDYQKATKTKVTVGVSGTGGGFKKFCRGEIDVQNASRPISESEIQACKQTGIEFLELPVAFDALTVVIHPKNTWAKTMTVAQLKRIWEPAAQGKVTHWNQINPAWPNAPLKLFGAGTDSGTFDYFTEAIVGRSKASRGDFTASEDDNVLVLGVSRDVNSLGYFGFAYYAEHKDKLQSVSIVNASGQPTPPSETSVMDGTYNPLSRPIFIYVSVKSLDRPEVRRFVEFYMANAPKISREVKYVPLPDSVYKNNLKIVADRRVGTIFGGHNVVGMTVEQMINKQVK